MADYTFTVNDKVDFGTAVEMITGEIQLLKKIEKEGRNEHTQKEVRSLISYTAGELIHEMAGKGIRLYISKAAQDLHKKMGLSVPFEDVRWSTQTRKKTLADEGRKFFHFEHMLPRSQLTEALCNLQPVNNKSVAGELEKASMAWITKEENEKLNKLKNEDGTSVRSNRPNLFAAYRDAGIELTEWVYEGKRSWLTKKELANHEKKLIR
ncbi:MAG: hypothetical protein LBF78_02990 [Treponema sp.]|nr:hypothetical protein [Treponema sp.]